jgi:hypothetical protein
VVTRLVAETKATMNKVRHQWSVIFGPRRPTARPHSRLVVSTRCRVYFFYPAGPQSVLFRAHPGKSANCFGGMNGVDKK